MISNLIYYLIKKSIVLIAFSIKSVFNKLTVNLIAFVSCRADLYKKYIIFNPGLIILLTVYNDITDICI